MPPRKPTVTLQAFHELDVRAGRVTRVEPFPEARRPALKLWIDFGPDVGELRSSAQLTRRAHDSLVGTWVLGLVNLPPLRVAGFESQCLVLGLVDPADAGDVALARPDGPVREGWPLA